MCCTAADHARLLLESEHVFSLFCEFGSCLARRDGSTRCGCDPSRASDCFPEARRKCAEHRGLKLHRQSRIKLQSTPKPPRRTVHICWVGMCRSHSADPHIGGIGAFDLVSLNPILRTYRKQTLPIASSHLFVDSTKNSPRSSGMMSRVEKTRRARAANKVTSSFPLFFKLGLHRTLLAINERPGVRGFLFEFLDDVYAVCGEPLRRRTDTDLEQRWRTFNTSQLADQRRASWRPKRGGVTVRRGFASRAKWDFCSGALHRARRFDHGTAVSDVGMRKLSGCCS